MGTAVRTASGKGEEFKTQDGRIGSGVGGHMNRGGAGLSEETEDILIGMHGVVGGLIDVWERRSFERIDRRRIDNDNDTTASQQFKQSLIDKRRLLISHEPTLGHIHHDTEELRESEDRESEDSHHMTTLTTSMTTTTNNDDDRQRPSSSAATLELHPA